MKKELKNKNNKNNLKNKNNKNNLKNKNNKNNLKNKNNKNNLKNKNNSKLVASFTQRSINYATHISMRAHQKNNNVG